MENQAISAPTTQTVAEQLLRQVVDKNVHLADAIVNLCDITSCILSHSGRIIHQEDSALLLTALDSSLERMRTEHQPSIKQAMTMKKIYHGTYETWVSGAKVAIAWSTKRIAEKALAG